MSKKTSISVRIPIVLLDALVKESEQRPIKMSSFIRQMLEERLPEENGAIYEKDESATITFLASSELHSRIAKATIQNDTSMSKLIVRMLSEELGVLPCRVVADADEKGTE